MLHVMLLKDAEEKTEESVTFINLMNSQGSKIGALLFLLLCLHLFSVFKNVAEAKSTFSSPTEGDKERYLLI